MEKPQLDASRKQYVSESSNYGSFEGFDQLCEEKVQAATNLEIKKHLTKHFVFINNQIALLEEFKVDSLAT